MVKTGPHTWKKGTSERPKSASAKPRKSRRLEENTKVNFTEKTLVTVVGSNLGADYLLNRTMAVRENSDGEEENASGSDASMVNPTGSNESGR